MSEPCLVTVSSSEVVSNLVLGSKRNSSESWYETDGLLRPDLSGSYFAARLASGTVSHRLFNADTQEHLLQGALCESSRLSSHFQSGGSWLQGMSLAALILSASQRLTGSLGEMARMLSVVLKRGQSNQWAVLPLGRGP